jgi:hypothetical protein
MSTTYEPLPDAVAMALLDPRLDAIWRKLLAPLPDDGDHAATSERLIDVPCFPFTPETDDQRANRQSCPREQDRPVRTARANRGLPGAISDDQTASLQQSTSELHHGDHHVS